MVDADLEPGWAMAPGVAGMNFNPSYFPGGYDTSLALWNDY